MKAGEEAEVGGQRLEVRDIIPDLISNFYPLTFNLRCVLRFVQFARTVPLSTQFPKISWTLAIRALRFNGFWKTATAPKLRAESK